MAASGTAPTKVLPIKRRKEREECNFEEIRSLKTFPGCPSTFLSEFLCPTLVPLSSPSPAASQKKDESILDPFHLVKRSQADRSKAVRPGSHMYTRNGKRNFIQCGPKSIEKLLAIEKLIAGSTPAGIGLGDEGLVLRNWF